MVRLMNIKSSHASTVSTHVPVSAVRSWDLQIIRCCFITPYPVASYIAILQPWTSQVTAMASASRCNSMAVTCRLTNLAEVIEWVPWAQSALRPIESSLFDSPLTTLLMTFIIHTPLLLLIRQPNESRLFWYRTHPHRLAYNCQCSYSN